MSESYIEIHLDQQPIELYKLLKIADLVSGGGEAKVVISEGYVLLNGEVEYQKRKKIYHNDIIEFNEEIIQLIINENLNKNSEDTSSSGYIHDSASKNSVNNQIPESKKNAAPVNPGTAKKNKRKPISF